MTGEWFEYPFNLLAGETALRVYVHASSVPLQPHYNASPHHPLILFRVWQLQQQNRRSCQYYGNRITV